MPTTTFLRLLAADDKAAALREATAAVRSGTPLSPQGEGQGVRSPTFTLDPASFGQIPGSPFGYWVGEDIRHTFSVFPALEPTIGIVKQGLATADDFRFVRGWWEVAPQVVVAGSNDVDTVDLSQQTRRGKRWASFAKGGSFSRYYNDPHLVANWESQGQEIKLRIDTRTGKPFSNVWQLKGTEAEYFFRPGLTYPSRTQGGFNVRVMPAGCIFGHKGPSIFVANDESETLLALLAIVNSAAFRQLLSMQMAFGSYEVGVVQRTPVPALRDDDQRALAALAREAHETKRDADRDDEVTHPFTVPALVRLRESGTLAQAGASLAAEDTERESRLAAIQREIDDRCFTLYGFSAEDRAQVEGTGPHPPTPSPTGEGEVTGDEAEDEDGDENAKPGNSGNWEQLQRAETANLLMYAVGCAFGRWDVRIGRDPSLAPKLAEPFAPLPVCAPGVLVGPDGLPATRERIASEAWLRARSDAITLPDPQLPLSSRERGPGGEVNQEANWVKSITADRYPMEVAWDGILVDDPDAPNDIVRRARTALDILWGDRASAIEMEACAILGARDLRDYLRNPRAFFDFHIGRYSKSRRKAPIYWLVQSPRRNFAIWLYYHRLDADLVFKALNFHLLPKIRLEEQRLEELKAAKQQAGTAGPEARRAAQAIDRQEALLTDLREFRDALDRAARHYLTPDLNDGVLLNIAPFWEVVPWKEAKTAWQQLLSGKYEWSSIGKQLREKGYVRGK